MELRQISKKVLFGFVLLFTILELYLAFVTTNFSVLLKPIIVPGVPGKRVSSPPDAAVDTTPCADRRKLFGPIPVKLNPPPLHEMALENPEVQKGGYFVPNCSHSQSVAILVAFRDREEHLNVFLYNLHPILQRQQLEYQIIVIEQAGTDPFNRATLFNIGFLEALKIRAFSCFIFHDVDSIPENDFNLYECHPQLNVVLHLSVSIQKFGYQPLYKGYLGGVTAMSRDQFIRVNGFSNRFWGWGGEDDDLSRRVQFHGLTISKKTETVGRYTSLRHAQQEENPSRFRLLDIGKSYFKKDGLSDLNYTLAQITMNPLYTFIKAQFPRNSSSI